LEDIVSNRLNFFFRQRVTESELDLGFSYLEQADRAFTVDLGLVNVAHGLAVAQQAVANLTVVVGGPGAAYDTQGQRIAIASNQTVNCAADYNAVSTAVAGGANEKWLSLFIVFDRALSDARVDGNSATVYFEEAESHTFKVVQGAEAAIGFATKPGLIVDHVLLADIRLINAQTQIVNADISTARRQVIFDIAGSPFAIKQGRFNDALGDLLAHLNTHITTGGPGVHDATSIAYAGGVAWYDGTANPAVSVEAQLDKIVADLKATTGAIKVGTAASAGTSFSLGAGSVASQLIAVKTEIDVMRTYGVQMVERFASLAALRAYPDNVDTHEYVVDGVGLFQYRASVYATVPDNGFDIILPDGDSAANPGRYVLVGPAGRLVASYSDDTTQNVTPATGAMAFFTLNINVPNVLPGDVIEVHTEFYAYGLSVFTPDTAINLKAALTKADATTIVYAPSTVGIFNHFSAAGNMSCNSHSCSSQFRYVVQAADIGGAAYGNLRARAQHSKNESGGAITAQADYRSCIVRHYRP
jgi:hypothetical protein